MEQTPKVGDVVRLNSGGPAMTVTAVNQVTVDCIFWNPFNHEFVKLNSIQPASLHESGTADVDVR